jgi:hypothetical protein
MLAEMEEDVPKSGMALVSEVGQKEVFEGGISYQLP